MRLYWLGFKRFKFDSRVLKDLVFFSIKQTLLAPLDKASIPNAPVPENGSRMVLLLISNWSQLNSVSLALAEVGRSPSESLNENFLPFKLPEIILKEFVLIINLNFLKLTEFIF